MTVADSSTVGFFLIDGKDCRGVTTEIRDPGLEWHTKEMLFLGQSLKSKPLTGVSSCDIEQTGAFDDAAGTVHLLLKTRADDRVLSWAPLGNTIGKEFRGALCDQVAYNPSELELDGFVMAGAKYSCTKHDTGLILADHVARGAAGDTKATYADFGAAATLGGVAYLELTDLTLGGYTNIVIKVWHSPDHSSWAELASFTAKTAVGAQRLAVATNPIERYRAVSWAYTGSGAGPSSTFAVGFANL